MRSVWLCAAVLCGCGLVDPAGTPLIEAHRGGAGNWPENSRRAITQAIAQPGYGGIEFDVVLTKDRIPVLSHDPWLNPALCRTTAGAELPSERVLIKDLTLSELQSGYRCGGVPDPASPDAEVVADTHLTLDELIDAVAARPDLTLHFDIKYEPELTLPLDAFFDEILSRWNGAGRPNPWYVSSTETDFLLEAKARNVEGRSYTWPKFVAGADTTLGALGAELLQQLGISDPISQARAAGANMMNMRFEVTDRSIVESARQEGMQVQLWTLNTDKVLDTYCGWPVDALITDYPEKAPCLPRE